MRSRSIGLGFAVWVSLSVPGSAQSVSGDDRDPSNRDRIADLAVAARLMLASSQTASYRIPPEVKRSLASAVAMSRLFDEKDVRVRQVRERAREIEQALGVLGEAIRRGRR